MKKIRILDLYCGCGGCSIGYYNGFKKQGYEPVITGVDWVDQPNYPYRFIKNDAINYLKFYGHTFDLIVASPPCQGYSTTGRLHNKHRPMLIGTTRDIINKLGKPYIIENVEGAKKEMIDPILICGLMVGLPMPRHRLFETNIPIKKPIHPKHTLKCTPMGRNHTEGFYYPSPCGNFPQFDLIKSVMELEHATNKKEVAQAIPPAYTAFIVDLIFDKRSLSLPVN